MSEQKINDGGAAFPHEADYVRGEKPGDPFQFKVDFHAGMTLRQWYAGQVIHDAIHNYTLHCRSGQMTGKPVLPDFSNEHERTSVAAIAFGLADAMIAHEQKEREQ